MIDRRIESEEKDDDGYWIYLRPGWKLAGEETHAIVEETRKEARAKLSDVVKCNCPECKP
jgi:hypothetical protein